MSLRSPDVKLGLFRPLGHHTSENSQTLLHGKKCLSRGPLHSLKFLNTERAAHTTQQCYTIIYGSKFLPGKQYYQNAY